MGVLGIANRVIAFFFFCNTDEFNDKTEEAFFEAEYSR